MMVDPTTSNGNAHVAGYGPPGGGYPPGPPPGAPPGGGGYGGYGGPPAGPPGGFGGPPPGFGPPGGFLPPGGPRMPGAGGDVNVTLPLVLSIVQIVICWNILFGAIALIFALQARTALGAGDIETARSKAKLANVIFAVGLVLEVVGIGLRFARVMLHSHGVHA